MHVLGREEEEAVMLEEWTASGLMHGREVQAIIAESCSQPLGSIIGELRGCPIDHDQQGVNLLRKCRIELQFALPPGQARRDELASVGVDRKTIDSEENGADSEEQVEKKRERGPRSAEPEDQIRDHLPYHRLPLARGDGFSLHGAHVGKDHSTFVVPSSGSLVLLLAGD
jgi:hypothetical protein